MRQGDQETDWTISLIKWLSEQFSLVHRQLGALTEGQMAAHQGRKEMARRLDQLEARLAHGQLLWLRHLPWTRITLMVIALILLVTGHLTITELKLLLARAITGSG